MYFYLVDSQNVFDHDFCSTCIECPMSFSRKVRLATPPNSELLRLVSYSQNIFHIHCTLKRFWNTELTLNIRTSARPSCSPKFLMNWSQRIPWMRLTPPLFQPHAREDNFPTTSVRWFVGTSSCWADTEELVTRRRHLQRARRAATTVEKSLGLLHPAKITWPSVRSPRYVTFQRLGRSFI